MKELFDIHVPDTPIFYYIILDDSYGYSLLKIGDTFEVNTERALDFYPNNLPISLGIETHPIQGELILFEKNKELWWKYLGKEGLALNKWHLTILKKIEEKEDAWD